MLFWLVNYSGWWQWWLWWCRFSISSPAVQREFWLVFELENADIVYSAEASVFILAALSYACLVCPEQYFVNLALTSVAVDVGNIRL